MKSQICRWTRQRRIKELGDDAKGGVRVSFSADEALINTGKCSAKPLSQSKLALKAKR